MDILHISAELNPIAKVGGLADVLHGFSRELIQQNQKVTILLPKYDILHLEHIEQLRIIDPHQLVAFEGRRYTNTLWQGRVDGIDVVFIEMGGAPHFFSRSKIYGCADDVARFCYFCLSAIEYLRQHNYDVVHLHDWHTALVAGLLKARHPEVEAQIVFTIHNFAYQGLCTAEDLEKVGWEEPALKEGELFNLLKAGILYADQVTTVSPSYAEELLNSDASKPLHITLQRCRKKFHGILNGIDAIYWNPETDRFLPHHYSVRSFHQKHLLKAQLRRTLRLTGEPHAPLVGIISRLVAQKGPELMKAALLKTLEWGGDFVLLGSLADDISDQVRFTNLKRTLAGSSFIHLEFSYNEELAHRLFAASDLFLVPSLFEPCGLTQQIAMRYGTVPLVRGTGGLLDTVFEGKNGFVFGPPTVEALYGALDRAFDTWYHQPTLWEKLIQRGMEADYSWRKPTLEYVERVYQRQSVANAGREVLNSEEAL